MMFSRHACAHDDLFRVSSTVMVMIRLSLLTGVVALNLAKPIAMLLLSSAWIRERACNSGLYIVARVSGLTDADGYVSSTLRLFNLEKIARAEAVVTLVQADLAFKTGKVFSIGGSKPAHRTLPCLFAIGDGVAAGQLLV